jgi:galactokinase/mevalonate kinase-like predicted kinase
LVLATAPGRCGIVGNPSDMYGGSVVSITTRERATCRIDASDVLTIASDQDRAVVREPADLALRGDTLDIARAVLTYFGIQRPDPPFALQMSTRIPMQAGMAGSTALVVAAVGALDAWFDWRMHPWAIAETARKVESRTMKVLCGFQDQHMAVFGGLNFMDFRGKESLEQLDSEPLATVEPLAPYAPAVPLLAAHTGVRHHSGTVHRTPRQRWLDGEPLVVDAYERLARLARLAKRALLAGDWPALGALMNENQSIVSSLGGSGEANDRLIRAARDAGAYGAKLAGAGGGGTILVLTDRLDHLARVLLAAGAESIWRPSPGEGLTVRRDG